MRTSGLGPAVARCFIHPQLRWFTYAVMALIVVNAILMGVEIDVSAQLGLEDIPSWFGIVP